MINSQEKHRYSSEENTNLINHIKYSHDNYSIVSIILSNKQENYSLIVIKENTIKITKKNMLPFLMKFEQL